MTYLIIIAVVAAAGIIRLWLSQRREVGRLHGVDTFRTSMEKISPYGDAAHPPHRADRGRGPGRATADLSPLEPARRAAAKRRIEARRRAARNRVAS